MTRTYDSEKIVLIGTVLTAASAIAIWLLAKALPESVLAIMLPMAVYSTGMGLALPNAMAVALKSFPHIAGTASSLLGFIQMSLSAGATALIGAYLIDTPAPLLDFMLVLTVIALGLSTLLFRRHIATKL